MIVANWKMNMDTASMAKFAVELNWFLSIKQPKNEIIIAPPFTLISMVKYLMSPLGVKAAAQNISEFDLGAHTGEVSAKHAKDVSCEYIIVGHSERRQNNNETNSIVRQKAELVAKHDMLPIVCVGETLAERESGNTEKVLLKQVAESVPDIRMDRFIIAYEPVWAIGTGKVPSNEDISFAAKIINAQLGKLNSFENNALILYGGSVNSSNCQEIMQISGIGGLLIGSASLRSNEFIKIIDSLG